MATTVDTRYHILSIELDQMLTLITCENVKLSYNIQV